MVAMRMERTIVVDVYGELLVSWNIQKRIYYVSSKGLFVGSEKVCVFGDTSFSSRVVASSL